MPEEEGLSVELRALLAGFMTAVVLTACQSSSPMISDDRLGRFFRDLMYGEDFALNRKNDRLLRWKGPIKVGISDDGSTALRLRDSGLS